MTTNVHLMSSETKQKLLFLSRNLKSLFPMEQEYIKGMLVWAQTKGKPFTYKQLRGINSIHNKVSHGRFIRD